jgi:hypothetical protein
MAMARFLAIFFRLAPFRLSDLGVNLRFSTREDNDRTYLDIPAPPFSLNCIDLREACDAESNAEKNAVTTYNESHDELCKSQFKLDSGTGLSFMGGSCHGEREAGLKGILLRFFREIVPECTEQWKFQGAPTTWFLQRCGVVSSHRTMRQSPKRSMFEDFERECEDSMGSFLLDSILSADEYCAALRTHEDASRLARNTKTLAGLMNHLENRGHLEASYVEGLTVELLPFQSQSLQWALERETVPGGIQTFWWAKLPEVEGMKETLYYNPIVGRISTEKPHLVRGGIIAEAMGLGKTVISLALILQNPAPPVPASGSQASSIPVPDQMHERLTSCFRDPDLYGRTSLTNAKRGSVLSQGTLVVCNVSLVGQWVAEAKSKLKNPGLVYPYYGQSRMRNPLTLAMNAIVVTTYETLASDATYHANKSSDASYCPPCEQVRWWRIICDESHVLRNGNSAKSEAVMNLVGDNKWLVSGTYIWKHISNNAHGI